jgi:hypothetical protein
VNQNGGAIEGDENGAWERVGVPQERRKPGIGLVRLRSFVNLAETRFGNRRARLLPPGGKPEDAAKP